MCGRRTRERCTKECDRLDDIHACLVIWRPDGGAGWDTIVHILWLSKHNCSVRWITGRIIASKWLPVSLGVCHLCYINPIEVMRRCACMRQKNWEGLACQQKAWESVMPPWKSWKKCHVNKEEINDKERDKENKEKNATEETDKGSIILRLSGRWWHHGLGGLAVQHLPCF